MTPTFQYWWLMLLTIFCLMQVIGMLLTYTFMKSIFKWQCYHSQMITTLLTKIMKPEVSSDDR